MADNTNRNVIKKPTTEIIQAFEMLTARYRVVPAYKVYAIWQGRAISPQPRRAIVLKATVILIVLIASTSIHAQPTSAWSTNGSRQPAKRQAPQSWWTDPGHQDPPASAWDS